MLPRDVGSGKKGGPQSPTGQMATERLNDMVMANAIAHAIRGIPGVREMGQGLFAKAATYGPGKHIAGIVFRRPAVEELAVEVHVVLEEATLLAALSDVSSRSNNTPILLHFADMIRVVISQTFEQLGLPAPIMVDVTIDDIR